MTDTVKKLRSLALKLYHLGDGQLVNDASDVMGVAAIEIETLRVEIEGLRAQLDERYIAMRVRQLEEALDAERQTARRLRADNERLFNEDTKTRHALKGWVWVCPDGGDEPTHERVAAVVAEVDRLRAEIERLRANLRECACTCSSIRECAAEWTKENHCLHLNARKALEGKP